MRTATHAERPHLTRPTVDFADLIRSQARSRELPLWVGRVLFGGYFIYGGLNHFLNLESMAGYAAAKDVPVPEVAVALSGLLIFLGGLSILSGQWPRLGALFFAVFLIGVTPTMHDFWAEAEPARAQQLAYFTRNLALLGAACLAMAIPEPWNPQPPPRPATVDEG